MKLKAPRDGYVRCEALLPALACFIFSNPNMPTLRVMGLLTEDGPLSLGVTAESAQAIADLLAKAAAEMREAS
jgi:hypothetical protein